MIEIVMHNSHHGNHEPALAATIEKTYVRNLENEVSYESRIYTLAAPVRRIRWPPPERAGRKQFSGGCGQTIQFLASIPSVRQSHVQQVDPRTPGMAPNTAWVVFRFGPTGLFQN
jgi:hypothetical protein